MIFSTVEGVVGVWDREVSIQEGAPVSDQLLV